MHLTAKESNIYVYKVVPTVWTSVLFVCSITTHAPLDLFATN